MGVRIMAVIGEDGTKLNTILVDERAIGHYTPGYGKYLIDEGPAINCQPAKDALVNFKLDFVGHEVLDLKVDGKPVQLKRIGDRVDLKTGAVTEKIEPVVDVVIEQPVIEGEASLDGN